MSENFREDKLPPEGHEKENNVFMAPINGIYFFTLIDSNGKKVVKQIGLKQGEIFGPFIDHKIKNVSLVK